MITLETRRKCSEAAKKGNAQRIYIEKPISEMRSWPRIRERIFKKRGRRCELCKWDKKNEQGVCPVQVHHKNGRQSHAEENLIVLCPNCHSLTTNFMRYGSSKRK